MAYQRFIGAKKDKEDKIDEKYYAVVVVFG